LKYSSNTAVTGLIEVEISLVAAFSNVDAPLSRSCLSINTMFTLMERGVDVLVGVCEKVAVAVARGVKVDVLVGAIVGVLLGVGEDITAAVADGVKDGVFEFVAVGGAWVTVDVKVKVKVGEDVNVDVNGSGVCETVGEFVAVVVIIKAVLVVAGV
jgi:hypothetical protein